MRIGELAQQAGISVSAVRYYEAQGLMPRPQTRESGYRDYTAGDLERLRLIVAAKPLRFPLRLIRLPTRRRRRSRLGREGDAHDGIVTPTQHHHRRHGKVVTGPRQRITPTRRIVRG